MGRQKKPLDSDAKMNVVMDKLIWRLDELLEKLEISLSKVGKLYIGTCPVHGGDNSTALNLYPEGHSLPGYWECQTHHCQKEFVPTLLGFIRGVLSHKYLGWAKPTDKAYSFPVVLRWIEKFLECKIDDIKVDYAEIERCKFIRAVDSFAITKKLEVKGVTRDNVRRHLIIPAQYYLNRGYSSDILDRYDVGLCNNPSAKEMYGRIVVPVYDDETGLMVGALGRSTYEECARCAHYHSEVEDCPVTDQEKFFLKKWRNASNFHKAQHLYNYWRAKRHIRRTGVIIIVEGPGDVWRLEEAGIYNSVGLFGNSLTDDQQIIIEMSGAMNVVALLDNDEAGCAGRNKIKDELQFSYKIHCPSYEGKDIGGATLDYIKQELAPLAKSLERKI